MSLGRTMSLDDYATTSGTIGDVDDGNIIVINVGGIRHETLVATLQSKPGTRLSNLSKRHNRGSKQEYFFDRHPGCFNTVMDYYRTGELHVPLNVCGAVVKRELDWWQIDDREIEPCCWIKYSTYIDTQQTLADFNESEKQEIEEYEALKSKTGWQLKQAKLWMILDYPRSSQLALAYAVTSFLFIVASITGFCIETLPDLMSSENVTRQCGGPDSSPATVKVFVIHPLLNMLDYVCTAFFTVELFVRIIFSPSKRKFFMSPMNIIDILALLPLYAQNFLEINDGYSCLGTNKAFLETIFILRIIRIFRIFHILKHYKALKILIHAIKASIQELAMLSIFLFIGMLIFSTAIFYAEGPDHFAGSKGKGVMFPTIPTGFWWSIITMTTVGYGDVYPVTAMGCAIGMICAISGVILVALTIPVISNNFGLFYLHARTRDQITNKDNTDTKVNTNKQSPNHRKSSRQSSCITLDRLDRESYRSRPLDFHALLPAIESNSTLHDAVMPLTATVSSAEEGEGPILMIDAENQEGQSHNFTSRTYSFHSVHRDSLTSL